MKAAVVVVLLAAGGASAKPLPRMFVSWSADGKKVLLLEAVRGKDTPDGPVMEPRRLVAVSVERSPLREVWSYDLTAGALDIAKQQAAAQGFDSTVENWPVLPNDPPFTSAPGNNVVLENPGWSARLQRRKFSTPALGYPGPTGRIAFIVPDERVVPLTPSLQLDLLRGWRQIDAEIPTYAHSAGPDPAVLQATLQRGAIRGSTLREEVNRLVSLLKWKAEGSLSSGRCPFGEWTGGSFLGGDGSMHIRAWFLSDGNDLAVITYIDASQPSPQDVEAAAKIALTARRAKP
jgi:hypothetical protein